MLAGWPLGLLLVARSAAVKEAATCPADARVEVNLAAWKAALVQAQGQPDEQRRRENLLADLKLTLAPPETDAAEAPASRVSLLGVDDAAVPLEADGPPDHVVQVRYSVEGADERTITLVQVLRPLEERRFCALGSALSRSDDAATRLETYHLSFVPLLEAHAQAIEVERAESQLRQNDTFREYWVAHGFSLRKIFEEKIGSMTSPSQGDGASDRDGGGPTTVVGKLVLAGGFPKRIELTEVTKRGGCEVRAGDSPCDDSEPSTTTTFVYDGTRYVRRR